MKPERPGRVSERIAEGKRRRSEVTREAQSRVNSKERRFDPLAVLKASAAGRVANLLPVKYGRMSVSPFAFFRGAVSIMAEDFARLPNSGLYAQLCGDAHLQNLGSFAAQDGRLVFDLNDFDETIRGPWEWDVKRMAASVVLAGRECGHDGAECRSAATVFVESYCASIREFAELPILQVARYQVHREDERIAPVHAALRQSERARPLDLLKKYTDASKNSAARFHHQPPLFRRITGKTGEQVLESLRTYRGTLAPERRHLFDMFRAVDVGFKVVGTGSVGLRDYVVLFEGNGKDDPMFLQIKQEVASAYASHVEAPERRHNGQRAAEGQRAIQPMSDLLLGWTSIGPYDFLVRQLNDHKGSIELDKLRGAGLTHLALLAGELLARGHARSGDACQIRGYCGSGEKMAKALAGFAVEYADQTEADYGLFTAAIRRGKIKTEAGDGKPAVKRAGA